MTASWKPHVLAFPHPEQVNLKIGDVVETTVDIAEAPSGSVGKIILANGFNWLRYRVRFANGVEVADLDQRHFKPIGKTARRLAKAAKRSGN